MKVTIDLRAGPNKRSWVKPEDVQKNIDALV
jgi:hypothetical protein